MPSIPLSKVPLCSSKQIAAALVRLGAKAGKSKGTSHQFFHRSDASRRRHGGVLVMGQSEIPRGTLRSLLQQLDISLEEFLGALS